MKRKVFLISILISVFFFFPPRSQGLHTDENLGGHQKIIDQGVALKKDVHKADPDGGDDFTRWANPPTIDAFRVGAADEDSTIAGLSPDPKGPNGRGNYFQHFLDPDTGEGFKGIWKSAVQRAFYYLYQIQQILGYNCGSFDKRDLSPEDIRRLNDYFSRIEHLIADVGNPNHTQDKSHVFRNEFEDYVAANWESIVNSDTFRGLVKADVYKEWIKDKENWTMNDPETFIYGMAQFSNPLSSGSEGLTVDQYAMKVSTLVAEAVRYTAGYIDAIYKGMSQGGVRSGLESSQRIMQVGLQSTIKELVGILSDAGGLPGGGFCFLPPEVVSPAGDHPDDRFDISDEFYWEKEFKLTDVDLTRLYLRTAIKKGKIGVWYKDQFMQTFFEGRAKYKDAPQEIKDAIEARFQALGEKLEQRKSQFASEWKGAPDNALFANGFYNPSISLMLKIGEPVSFEDVDFNPGMVKDHPVMLVPTGGFYGLKNADGVKKRLEEYVKNGGTLVLFAQQHGYDWGLLPTPINPETGERKPVSGYGYQEDQSCAFNSVYIDTYHSILSVFSTSTANIGVDGYFTSYPENSTVLLRRMANGQPAMILYPYGQGYVIITTLYTDFAFSHNQSNQAEINLVQNIISWAKKPAQLPEIKPGETVSVSAEIKNYMDTDAASVKFSILDPKRTVISEQRQNVSISAGQSATIPVSYATTPSSSLGIYHIDYTLFDTQGNVIQPQAETDSGRFVVSNPPKTGTFDKPIWFSVSTSSQEVLFGAPFDFTFHVFNNTDESRNLTIRNNLRHTGRGQEWKVTANPNSETRVSGTEVFIDRTWMFETMESILYDESMKEIGRYQLSFKGFYPSAGVSIQTDKAMYGKSEPLTITVSLKNNNLLSWQSNLKISITGPYNNKIFEETKTFSLSPKGTASADSHFSLPADLSPGTYVISVGAYYGDSSVSSSSARFELCQSQILVNPDIPSILKAGANNVPFNMANTGKINVSSGVLDISLQDPDGIVVYSGRQPFSIGVGQSTTMNIPLDLSSLKFGTYTLTFIQSDETREGVPASVIFTNDATMTLTLDKPSYRVRETANLRVDLTNTGNFNFENVPLTLSVWDAGYTDTRIISLFSNQSSRLNFSIPIPDTIIAGQHSVDVAVGLSSGASLTRSTVLTVPESKLVIGYSGPTSLRAGDTIGLTIENNGGVDATYSTENLTIKDSKGTVIYRGSVTGTILVGERKILTDIQIPSQAINGLAFLRLQIMDSTTGKKTNFYQSFEIAGLTATLRADTDKSAYLKAEEITGQASITSELLGIEGGSLRLGVSRIRRAGGGTGPGQFSHFLPVKGWASVELPRAVSVGSDGSFYVVGGAYQTQIKKFDSGGNFITKWGGNCKTDTNSDWVLEQSCEGQFSDPGGIAVEPGGSVYVADTANSRIQKFDRNGNFMTTWGRKGNGDGEFYDPKGIAVGLEGFVYVLDSWVSRVQKFDSNGNFIAKWGSEGSGDGQFSNPEGIAVGVDGFVYVADSGNHRIQKFDGNGKFIAKWGNQCKVDTNWDGVAEQACEGQFYHPEGIAVGGDGLVYVVENENYRIQKFDSQGAFLTKWGMSYGLRDGQFNGLSGIAVGADGSVYVADLYNGRIQKFDGNGTFVTKWGILGVDDGEFAYTDRLAVGLDNSIYVADYGNNRIEKFDGDGNFILKWGSEGKGDGQFDIPHGVAIGFDGSVYVVDQGNYRIQKFDSDGHFVLKWGSRGSGDGEFEGATGIAIGPDGLVYVVDIMNSRLQKFDCDGNFITKWEGAGFEEGEVWWPEDLAVGSDGFVYVTDMLNDCVQKFDSNGTFISKWGREGSGDGEFSYLEGIAVGPDGSVYVSDGDNNRIQKFDSNGNFIAKWGSQGGGDGEFYYPYGIAVGPDGVVYVADSGNSRIQRMMPEGIPEAIFQVTLPINQAGSTTQNYSTPIGPLEGTGKLYLQATLLNNLGQTIAQASYPFYIYEGNTALLLETDRRVYKPGEAVVITGQVENRAAAGVNELVFSLTSKVGAQSSQLILAGPFNIPAGGSQPFTVTAAAGAEGVVILTGKVSQNESILAEVMEQYEVAKPRVSVIVTAPDVVGNDPFPIDVQVKNTGKREAAIQFGVQSSGGGSEFRDSQAMTLAAGETKLLQYSQQITSDTTYTFTTTGDWEQTVNKTVGYGLQAYFYVYPDAIFPEGQVAVPVWIANNGPLAESINVSYQLSPRASQQSKIYYLAPWGGMPDTLYFNLTEGDYQITASSQIPQASAQASFSVRKMDKIDVGVSPGTQADGLIPINVNLTNMGWNEISGSVGVRVSDQNTTLWTSQQPVGQLSALGSQLFAFGFDPSAMPPGNYTLRAEVLSSSNQQLAVSNQQLTINGPVFQISQLPASQTFYPGEEASLTFRIKNTGDQEGAVEFHLKAYDLIDLTRREWLKAGEEKGLPFSFMLPADLEEKDYFADYEMKGSGVQGLEGSRGQVKYHLAGIHLNVQASLDKASYQEGEVAHLSISVSSLSPPLSALNLFARVNYPGYESKEPFILNSSQALFFDIPLTKITGEKLFFGIYQESGRSLHLNSLYIRKAGDVLAMATDKEVYKPGETVSISVSGTVSGSLALNGPSYEETFAFNGPVIRNFALPSTMTAGTYYVSYQLSTPGGQSYTGSHPFDVAGIQIKVKEATFDKAKYASSDTINLSLLIESNQNLAAALKTWVVDPEKGYISNGTQAVNLSSSAPLLTTLTSPFTANKLGIHRLVYGIYSGDLLLCSGSEAFDMGEAVVLEVSSKQADYPTGQEVVGIVASLYGTIPATLDFLLDDQPAGSEIISLSGFSNIQYSIPVVSPGRHSLKARLTSGGLTSTKEISFLYGSSLPDLFVSLSRDQSIQGKNVEVSLTVTNRGKSPSGSTILYLYDGQITEERLLGTFAVNGLAPGESQTFDYELNALGRTGSNTLLASVDPAGSVYEFSKANNQGSISFSVPDLALSTNLEKEVYFTGDSIVITGQITNLSKGPLTNITLTTTVRDAALLPIFTNSQTILSLDGLVTITVPVPWQTNLNLPEGVYTISQSIEGRGVPTQRVVTLRVGKDFTIAGDPIDKRVEIGEPVQYNLALTSIRGFDGEVSLSIQGCPAGFTASFFPNPVSLAGGQAQAIFKMIPTAQAQSGSYPMKVYAAGGGRSHEVSLLLELTDFQVAVLPGAQRIRQLEGASYAISLSSVNGFSSLVSVEVTGVPRGMRASLEASQVTVPRDIKITLTTSKWLLPGTYPITVTAKGKVVHHEAAATLVVDRNPVLTPGVITAPGWQSRPIIRSYAVDGVLLSQFQAFDSRGSVNIAAGDVDGDGIDEVIVGADSKSHRSAALVGVFKRDGTSVGAMELEPERHRIRVTVAAGDVDGDWIEEVGVGLYPYPPDEVDEEEDNGHRDSRDEREENKTHHEQEGQGLVRIYQVVGGKFIDTGFALYPYEGEGYRGAPNVVFGDVDGDGMPELITAPGPDPLAPARIKVFKIDTKEGTGRWKIGSQLADLLISFEGRKEHTKGHEDKRGSFRYPDGYGANIAAGDVDGDGKDEIIVGAGPDPRKDGQVIILYNKDGVYRGEFFIACEGTSFGVELSSEDIDWDGLAEILTGMGPDPRNKSMVRIFRRDGTTLGEFQAYPDNMRYGVKVSKGAVGE